MKGFIIKEFYHIFRDLRSMLILFGMPVVQVLLFGFAISNEIKNAPIAILDHSKDAITEQLTNKILSSGYFQLYDNLQNESQVIDIFKKGVVKEVLVFEPGFAKKLEKEHVANIQLLADASDPNTANLIVNYTSAIITNYQMEHYSNLSFPVTITAESKMLYNPDLKSVFMFVPGIITILLMLISAMMTSISIAREKELGTMEILLVSPLKPVQVIAGKVLPYVLLSCINSISILLLSYFVFGMPFRGSLVLLMAESVLFISMALSLGIFISTVSNSQQIAMLLSMFALMLPTILLSGFIFPIENMPLALQLLSNIMPSRWFIIILRAIMLKGLGLQYIWKETLIIACMMAFFLFLSVMKFKVRLE